jgi:hypothetical protein
MSKEDIRILEALYNGYHLSKSEQERAKEIMHKLNIYFKQQ